MKERRISSLKSGICFASFLVGLSLVIFYLSSLRIGLTVNVMVFWLGLSLMSSTLVLMSSMRKNKLFLLTLYLSSLCLLLWGPLRFGGIFGTDIMNERVVASYTSNRGLTQQLLNEHLYGGSLDVTILPAVISHVTGISVPGVFEYVLPIILAFLPIFLYLLIKQITNSADVAALGSIIFVLDYVNLTLLPQVMRESMAKLFLILALFILFKRLERKVVKLTTILYVSILGVIVFHYTSALFTLALLAFLKVYSVFESKGILLGSTEARWKANHLMPTILISSAFVLTLTWKVFVTPFIFNQEVSIGWDIFIKIRWMHPGFTHPYTQYTIALPRGAFFSSAVALLYRLLILLGAVICFWKYKSFKIRAFTFLGTLMMLMLIIWIITPQTSRALNLDRVYGFGLLFFPFFIASTLLYIASHLERISQSLLRMHTNSKMTKILSGNIRQIALCFFISLFFLNHVLILPTFYYLPTSVVPHDELISAPFFIKEDTAFGTWISNQNQSDTLVLGDLRSREILAWSSNTPFLSPYSLLLSPRTPHPRELQATKQYTVVMDYTIKENYLVEYLLSGYMLKVNATVTQMPSGRVVIHSTALNTTQRPRVQLIYQNGRNYLLYSNFIWYLDYLTPP